MNWCYAILSYNHSEHTRNCIRSVLAVSPSSRIYVIHNGTEPKQRALVQNEFPASPILSHIIFDTNTGFSGGLNRGLAVLFESEDFVFVLTNDTELSDIPKNEIPKGVTIPLILNKRTKKVDSFGGYFQPAKGHIYHNKNLTTVFEDSKQRLTYIPGSAFLIDRNSFVATGGFWEDLGTYWEDVEWSQRLKTAMRPLVLNSEFKLFHKIGKTCHKDSFYTTYLFQRNRLVVSWLYTGFWSRLSLLFRSQWNLLKWTTKCVSNSKYSSLRLYLRAIWHAIKMIKENSRRPQGMGQ